MIKEMDMENISLKMEEYIKAIGKMDFNMGKVNFIIQKIIYGLKEFG